MRYHPGVRHTHSRMGTFHNLCKLWNVQIVSRFVHSTNRETMQQSLVSHSEAPIGYFISYWHLELRSSVIATSDLRYFHFSYKLKTI